MCVFAAVLYGDMYIVHKSTLYPIATDRFSNETFPSTYCEDEHRQSILIYLWGRPSPLESWGEVPLLRI